LPEVRLPYNAAVPEATDFGLGAWTLDPATCIVSGSFVATSWYLASFVWKTGDLSVAPFPTRILIPNVIVGSWTLLQVGIVNQDPVGNNAAGTVLASSTPTLPTAGVTSQVITPIAAAPSVLPQGRYWVIANVTGTTGTALAASNPGTSGSLGTNMGTDTAHARFGIAGATGASLPASIVPANIVSTTSAGLCLCAGVL
jgi:hypothetical protein